MFAGWCCRGTRVASKFPTHVTASLHKPTQLNSSACTPSHATRFASTSTTHTRTDLVPSSRARRSGAYPSSASSAQATLTELCRSKRIHATRQTQWQKRMPTPQTVSTAVAVSCTNVHWEEYKEADTPACTTPPAYLFSHPQTCVRGVQLRRPSALTLGPVTHVAARK